MLAERAPKLKRNITFIEVTLYGIGVIIGAGIYALIGSVAGIAGNAMWMAFILAAVTAMFTALSYAELSSMMPKAAAEYVYSKRALKSGALAFVIGWTTIYVGMLTVSTVAVGFAGYAQFFVQFPAFWISVALILALSVLNFWGIKESAILNAGFTFIEVLGLIAIIAISIPFFGSVNYFEVPGGAIGPLGLFGPIAAASAIIFFAYLGFEDIANLSEETKSARKNIPKALLLALAFSTVIYVLVSIAAVSVVPWQELSKSSAPMELIASRATGGQASGVLAIVGLFATLSTILISLIVLSRRIYGMASEGILPRHFARVHSITGTPHFAILVSGIGAIIFVLFGGISQIASLTNMGLFIIFFFVNASLIALRFKEPNAERAFRVPLSIGKVSVPAVFGCVFSFLMIFQLTETINIVGIEVPILVIGGIIILLSVPFYKLFISGKRA